jgi:hypothetical protein
MGRVLSKLPERSGGNSRAADDVPIDTRSDSFTTRITRLKVSHVIVAGIIMRIPAPKKIDIYGSSFSVVATRTNFDFSLVPKSRFLRYRNVGYAIRSGWQKFLCDFSAPIPDAYADLPEQHFCRFMFHFRVIDRPGCVNGVTV